MPDDKLLDQAEIERLINQAKPSGGTPDSAAAPPSPGGAPADQALDQSEIEALLSRAGAPSSPDPTATAREGDQGAKAGKPTGQDDTGKLLGRSGTSPNAAGQTPEPAEQASLTPSAADEVAHQDVEYLLNQAERALQSIDMGNEQDLPPGVAAFRLEEFPGAPASTEVATLDLIRDVELDLKIELGRTHMYLEDVLKLRKGAVVPLDKLAGDPVDVYVNQRLVARGEVLVLNDSFCVRIAELIAGVGASS